MQSLDVLTSKSDYHLISPYNIIPESNIKVTRIKEMISKSRDSRPLKQIFLVSNFHCLLYRGLSRNPLLCTQDLKWLQTWIDLHPSVHSVDEVMCQTPVGNWSKVATFNFSLLGKIVSLFLGLSINLLVTRTRTS